MLELRLEKRMRKNQLHIEYIIAEMKTNPSRASSAAKLARTFSNLYSIPATNCAASPFR
jgi:hypothetical protein